MFTLLIELLMYHDRSRSQNQHGKILPLDLCLVPRIFNTDLKSPFSKHVLALNLYYCTEGNRYIYHFGSFWQETGV